MRAVDLLRIRILNAVTAKTKLIPGESVISAVYAVTVPLVLFVTLALIVNDDPPATGWLAGLSQRDIERGIRA